MIGLIHSRRSPSGGPEAEGAGEALDHGFAEFVPVIGCAVARLDLDLEGRGKIIRIRI